MQYTTLLTSQPPYQWQLLNISMSATHSRLSFPPCQMSEEVGTSHTKTAINWHLINESVTMKYSTLHFTMQIVTSCIFLPFWSYSVSSKSSWSEESICCCDHSGNQATGHEFSTLLDMYLGKHSARKISITSKPFETLQATVLQKSCNLFSVYKLLC